MATASTVFNFRLTEATIVLNGGMVSVWGPEGKRTEIPAGGRYVFTDGTVDDADGGLLIEDLLYYSRNHDVWLSGMDADEHYATHGWQEGRATGGLFDARAYLEANPDVASAGIDPLTHYRVFGWREGRDPSPFFDTKGYLDANPDVAASGLDPLEHYIAFGRFEGRSATPGALQVKGFDADFYLARYPDIVTSGMNPQEHYVLFGRAEGRAANAVFDREQYLAQNPDVAAAGMDPLEHYLRFGWREGRDPSAEFSGAKYLADHPDVAEAQRNPLLHFLTDGTGENRAIRPVAEAPTDITLAALVLDEAMPGAVVGALDTVDADGGPFDYSVDDARFEVVKGLLKLKDGIALDFEAEPALRLTVTATDTTGLSVTRGFDLTVRDVNETPASLSLETAPLYENVAGANVGRLSAIDPDAGDSLTFSTADDRFEVVDGTLLKLRDGVSLDFEAAAKIAVLVRATDAQGLWTERLFTVPALDANDSPTDIRLKGDFVHENERGAVIGTLTAIDADAGDTHRFMVDDDRFEVVGNVLKLKEGLFLDHEKAATVTIEVTATDQNGEGLSVTTPFIITVGDVNEAPASLSLETAPLYENVAGADVGRLSAIDPDAGDSLTFSTADDRFEVVDGTLLKLRDGVSLDFEAAAEIAVLVRATDAQGLWTERLFPVSVLDANDSPTDIRLKGDFVHENARGAVIGTLTAIDPDAGDTHRFVVDDDRFEVVGNVLKLKEGLFLDHEKAATVTIEVTATDRNGEGLSVTTPFVITVGDVNEAPVFGGVHAGTVVEDGLATASGKLTIDDPDAGESHFRATTLESLYGKLTLGEDGDWTYDFTGNALPQVQALNTGESLRDIFTVQSADGTKTQIAIAIAGTDDIPVADFTFETGLTGWERFGDVYDPNMQNGDKVASMYSWSHSATGENLSEVTDFLGGSELPVAPAPAYASAAIRTTVEVKAGQVISFEYTFFNQYLQNRGDSAGLSLVSLQNESHSQVKVISDQPGNWQELKIFQMVAEESGVFKLGFAALAHNLDPHGYAELRVDDILISDPVWIG